MTHAPRSPADRAAEPASLVGGKYLVSRRIGEGAMGVVFAAVNELTEREVALKLVARHGLTAAKLRTRLLREARACGRINHRNVLEIIDVGQTAAGDPFLVMPLLRGETLRAKVRRERRLEPEDAARILADVARGLASAHAAGVVHRDLKPSNIFLHSESDRAEPVVKLLDFGLSKLVSTEEVTATSIGATIGSPGYMSPEQVRAVRELDHRTDLWSLGVILFEAIAGVRPFGSGVTVRAMAEVIGGPIPTLESAVPGVDPRLAALVRRCLERDVNRRIGSAAEVAEILDAVARDADRFDGDATIRDVTADAIAEDDVEPPTRRLTTPPGGFHLPVGLRGAAPGRIEVATSSPPHADGDTATLHWPPARRVAPRPKAPRAAPFLTGAIVGASAAVVIWLTAQTPAREAGIRHGVAPAVARSRVLAGAATRVCERASEATAAPAASSTSTSTSTSPSTSATTSAPSVKRPMPQVVKSGLDGLPTDPG